jgi:hypothetical protein
MSSAFPAQPYRDRDNIGTHRGVVSVTGSLTVNLGIGHNNFTVDALNVKSNLAADVNAASVLSWDYHPTLKGAFVISAWKATAAGTTTLIAATAPVNVSFIAQAGASVIGG